MDKTQVVMRFDWIIKKSLSRKCLKPFFYLVGRKGFETSASQNDYFS
jgi:hypothetical protein